MSEPFKLLIQFQPRFYEHPDAPGHYILELLWLPYGNTSPGSTALLVKKDDLKSDADRRSFETRLLEDFKANLPEWLFTDIRDLWLSLGNALGAEFGFSVWKGTTPEEAKREIVQGRVESRRRLMRSTLHLRGAGRRETLSPAGLRRKIRAAIKEIVKEGGQPKRSAVAGRMGMSEDALAKQLERKELSFRAIRQEILDKLKKTT